MMTLEKLFSRCVRAASGCLEWQGAKDPKGYGHAWFEGRLQYTHRICKQLTDGAPIPAGLNVLHSCDNPPCCEPSHLRAGTQKENIQEASHKSRLIGNRGAAGIGNPRVRLTENQVMMMRHWKHLGPTVWARVLGVTKATASKVILGQTWKHLPA